MGRLIAHLRLTRPANIITAIADILAGFSVVGAIFLIFTGGENNTLNELLWLVLSTIGLYGGGVAFNDVFDADLDQIERPERPIPSGQASVTSAAIMAFALLLIGVVAALMVSVFSGTVALSVALLAVLYDYWGKHQLVFGPINMGLCRSGNLFLGMSVFPVLAIDNWYLCLIPLFYVAAITMVSRGEVHGKNKRALQGGLLIYTLIIVSIFTLAFVNEAHWIESLPFVLLLGYFIYPPLFKALKQQDPALIGRAVKAAVLSLIILNATLASAFGGWQVGLLILMLMPVSLQLAKAFAVT